MLFAPLPISLRRSLLILAGLLVCFFAASVLWYAQTTPDVGLRCAITPEVNHAFPEYFRSIPASIQAGRYQTEHDRIEDGLRPGDIVLRLGGESIEIGPQVQRALIDLAKKSPPEVASLTEAEHQKLKYVGILGEPLVFVEFLRRHPDGGAVSELGCWLYMGRMPVEELIPSVLWAFLKIGLFAVGALVFWKRPTDRAAAQFFLLCIVTVGAYMGGYHWERIATQPVLLTVFMVCGVLLPVVSLHFYLVFPKPKTILEAHPNLTLLTLYGPSLGFLIIWLFSYMRIRGLVREGDPERIADAWFMLRMEIAAYFIVAAFWYLASITALIHSYRTAADITERNQVKWILYGSLVAMVPIGYTLYLIFWQRNAFGAGAGTWPMFAASVCFTAAFAVSITRYRLLQLDQIVSSGAIYFLISILAGVVYFAVVFAGMLAANLFGRRSFP